ncbi:MAG: glycosyltransferase family 4 protein [Chloroflexi bacterium]|nr:glycosyltransferase family 4 protein [Chloroflexota bacterium]
MHIGLNAHLLSGDASYRAAGIAGYMANVMRWLPRVVPDDWRLTAFVGAQFSANLDGFVVQRSTIDTSSPVKRIAWEQVVQPWAVRSIDGLHAQAFVSPVLSRVPTIVNVYDLSFVHYPQVLTAARRLYLRMLTPLSCRRARRVIAISQSTADDLVSVFRIPRDKIDIALGAHDPERYRPLPEADVEAFRAAKNLPDRFWLFVGTIEPRKNLVRLLTAYAQLDPNDRPPLIIGGGRGWLADDVFEAVRRFNLESSVRFVGYVPVEDLPLWYNSAELFVFPSVHEGFGLPVLEAMACGTPVVTSNVSSLPEVTGDVALGVDPHSVDDLVSALRRANTDEAWRLKAARAGIERAGTFSWTETARQTVGAYRKGFE